MARDDSMPLPRRSAVASLAARRTDSLTRWPAPLYFNCGPTATPSRADTATRCDHERGGAMSDVELRVGQIFTTPSKTLTDAHFLFFSGLTGDNHPIHYDVEYAKTTRFGTPLRS